MSLRYLEPDALPDGPDVPVYGSGAWLQVIVAHSPWPLRIVALEEEGQVVAWHPFLLVQRGAWRRALPLFVDTTGGPYFRVPAGLVFAEKARWLREKQRALLDGLATAVEFATLCPLESDPRALPESGSWKTVVRATARLDLNLEPQPWSSQALRKLRKAANKGLSLQRVQSPQRLAEALQSVQERHLLSSARLDTGAFLALREALQQRGLVDTWAVCDAVGNEVAYGIVVPDAATDSVRFWYNLNTPAGLKLYASDFLFHGIAQAYRGRLRWFDLCGADDANLIAFKEKWASETVFSFAYDYARKSWMRAALAAFGILRRQIRR